MNSATSTEPNVHAAAANAAAAFRPWHFFVILTLIAATAAVLVSRKTAPENLVMLSLTVFAAGGASIAVYRTLVPLVGRERTLRAETLGHRARAALEREKLLVLRSIKELEFDQAMGKLADADFEEMSERLRARALGLMRQLEATHAAPRERIERELADRLARDARRSGSGSGGSGSGSGAGSGVAVRAATVPPVAAVVVVACEACGTSNDADARFCKECGTKLAKGAAHA